MNGKPNKKQQDFHDWARSLGCFVQKGYEPVAIHHIKGSKMKLKGVKGAGEWYVLPVSYFWHQSGENDAAIHINRKRFESFWEMSEKDFWICLIDDYESQFNRKPMTEEEYQIIVDRA